MNVFVKTIEIKGVKIIYQISKIRKNIFVTCGFFFSI